MNKKFQNSLIVLVAVVLVLAVTIPSLAKPDIFFNLEAEYTVDWVDLTMRGPFSSTGAIEDNGTSWGHWVLQPGVRTGMLFFESEEVQDNVFVIQWKVPYFDFDEENCVKGTFTIYAYLGTGEYEGLWGTGTLKTCRPDMNSDKVIVTLEGRIP